MVDNTRLHTHHMLLLIPSKQEKLKKKLHTLTLKHALMEENLDDFDDSSGSGGNRPTTKEHFEAVNKA